MKFELHEEEIKSLRKSKDEGVQKLLGFYEAICMDDSIDFFMSLKRTIAILGGDLNAICDGKTSEELIILGNDKDDKLYERVRTLLVDSDKIFGGLKKGREGILSPLQEDDVALGSKRRAKKF